jgi:hypothetical protein
MEYPEVYEIVVDYTEPLALQFLPFRNVPVSAVCCENLEFFETIHPCHVPCGLGLDTVQSTLNPCLIVAGVTEDLQYCQDATFVVKL